MKLPLQLYHATYGLLLPKIREEGLGGKSAKPNWPDSKIGVTYWAKSPDIAFSYAETCEDVPEEWLSQIVVFSCDIHNFDLNKLFLDPNVIENDDATFEYHGIVPYEYLKEIDDEDI